MTELLQYQQRITLVDECAEAARCERDNPAIRALTKLLVRHDATLKCQYDAFAGYCTEAEQRGIEQYPLYAWTKAVIEDPVKKAKFVKSFAVYVGGEEVYSKAEADALDVDLRPLVGRGVVTAMVRYDTNPANSPQPPKRYRS